MDKVSWGVLSTANIGVKKVIPAMQRGMISSVDAIASRNIEQAREVADKLNIPKAYGTYEELLADPDIEAIYIPLPNHLHVPWTIKAMEAGKHVLCEKPIGLDVGEAAYLLEETKKYPHLKIMEAFMYRHHPQWIKVQQLIKNGAIGDLVTIHSHFSYYLDDPNNVRNKPGIGGGGLMDVGCYCISVPRLLFGGEPNKVIGSMSNDPAFQVDRLASGILHFDNGTATFTCGTQMERYQRVQIFGTKGRIEVIDPFGPPNAPTSIMLQQGDSLEEIKFDTIDFYTLQGDIFSAAIRKDLSVFTPLDDAVANMSVIDRLRNSI